MRKQLAISLAAALCATPALAQTPGGSACPYIAAGAALTPAQWNYCFQVKQDFIGYIPLNKAGDTMLGELITTSSQPSGAGLNIQPGTAPTLPNNGDMWLTSAGVFARVNGVTIGPLGGASSASFAATQPLAVTFPSGVTTYALNFNSSLLKDGSNNLGINLANPNTWTATQTFPNNSLTLAEFPTIGANTVLGSIAGGTPIALSQTQLTSLIQFRGHSGHHRCRTVCDRARYRHAGDAEQYSERRRLHWKSYRLGRGTDRLYAGKPS